MHTINRPIFNQDNQKIRPIMKIILIQFLAVNAFYMQRSALNSTITALDTKILLETTAEVPCDWPWARRHAFAIAGFIIGLFFFPICMYCTGFREDGPAANSCASDAQR